MIRIFTIACSLILCTASTKAAQPAHHFELQAGDAARENCPIWIALPENLRDAKHLQLTNKSNNQSVPSQLSEDGKQLVFILDQKLASGESRSYDISINSAPPKGEGTKCLIKDGTISLVIGERTILTYHTTVAEPPPGISPLLNRSGHIHPFITPGGKVVTDEYPSDHLHQHAIFAAWTKTFFEGERVDFWNQLAGTGTVGHREVLESTSGPVFASFKVRLVHRVLKDNPRDVLDETWTVRLYNIRDLHIFDIESVQTCVAKTPLTIAEYHYGGFAYRGSAEWIKNDQHHIITNETEDREVGNHTKPNWTAVYGPVSGDLCGAAMFSHPSNFRSPQPVRLHPSMPYFVYSPAVLGEFDLKPGKPYETRNRYVSFDEKPDAKQLNLAWEAYSSPPEVKWTETP